MSVTRLSRFSRASLDRRCYRNAELAEADNAAKTRTRDRTFPPGRWWRPAGRQLVANYNEIRLVNSSSVFEQRMTGDEEHAHPTSRSAADGLGVHAFRLACGAELGDQAEATVASMAEH